MKHISKKHVWIATFVLVGIAVITAAILFMPHNTSEPTPLSLDNTNPISWAVEDRIAPEQRTFLNASVQNFYDEPCSFKSGNIHCSSIDYELPEAEKKKLSQLATDDTRIIRYELTITDTDNDILIDNKDIKVKAISDVDLSFKNTTLRVAGVSYNSEILLQAQDYFLLDTKYIQSGDIIALVPTLAPQFQQAFIKTTINNRDFSGKAFLDHNATPLLVFTIQDPIGTTATITLSGYTRTSTEQYTITPIQKNISVWSTKQTDNTLEIQLSNLQENQEYTVKVSNETSSYMINFSTVKPFAITKNENNKDTNNYHLCFSRPIKEDITRSILDSTFWSGNFSLAFSESTESYEDNPQNNYCMLIYYYVDPTETHTVTLTGIQSRFGDKTNVTMTLPPHTIADDQRFVTVVGQRINVLPKNGERTNKLQLNYKNFTWTDLYIRTCSLITDGKTRRKNMETIETTDYDTETLRTVLNCGKTSHFTRTFSWFTRRKSKVITLDLSEFFSWSLPEIFQIWVADFNKVYPKTFIRTNIGTLVKYSNNQAHIWTYALDSGAPQQADLELLTLTQKSTDQKKQTTSGYTHIDFPENDTPIGLLIARTANDSSITILGDNRTYRNVWEDYKTFSNSFGIESYQIGWGGYRNNSQMYTIYAYTDRVLYKAGDKVHISGWIRKWLREVLQKWSLEITFTNPMWNVIETRTVKKFDRFGWFADEFVLGQNIPLGTYNLQFTYTNDKGESSYYYSYIEIQEYKKPSFFADFQQHIDTEKNQLLFSIMPRYYFGKNVESYDLDVSYSIQGQSYGLRDWNRCGQTRCDQPRIYGQIWWTNYYDGNNFSVKNHKESVTIPVNIQTPVIANISMNLSIKDTKTQEVVTQYRDKKIYPQYLVGLKGYDYDRYALGNADTGYLLEGKILSYVDDTKDDLDNYTADTSAKTVRIVAYYKDFNNDEERWPDGERYFTQDNTFTPIVNQEIPVQDGAFSTKLSFSQPGKYFVRAIYESWYESQRTINVYDTSRGSFYGDMKNNYALSVQVPERDYNPGDMIDVSIEPYIKWAQAIITVEKDGNILYHEQRILDGTPIQLKADKNRFPNAHVWIVQIIGETLNKTLSSRSEPRFLIGYGNMKLAPSSMQLQYNVKVTDEKGNTPEFFAPGQKVQLQITVKDKNNNPVDARISIGVIDKSLLALYDRIRTPLEEFYTQSAPGFRIASTLHLLYNALKVFTADGTKGGDGSTPGGSNLFEPRKRFLDVAFWKADAITNKDGVITATFTLPDNLTTWVVDLIGVGANGEMWTNRSYFITSKKVILQPNLPRFLSYQDEIKIPVGLIFTTSGVEKTKPTWRIQIGKHKQNISFSPIQDSSDKRETTISLKNIPLDVILQNDSVLVHMQADKFDSIEMPIPLRKDGLTLHAFAGLTGKSNATILDLWTTAANARLEITVSPMPINTLQNAIRYLLHYPYGCTEQMLSSIYPLIIADSLSRQWYIGKDIVYDGLFLQGGEKKKIQTIINDTLPKIYRNQKENGLFGYRSDWSEEWDYDLSLYVYNVFTVLKKQKYSIDATVFKKLESALTKSPDDLQRISYIRHQSQNNKKPNLSTVEEIVQRNIWSSQEAYIVAYGYAIYAFAGENKSNWASILEKHISRLYSFNAFYDIYTIKSLYLRWLIANKLIDDAQRIVIDLHNSVDSEGKRWRDTQANMQVIIALQEYMQAITSDKDVSFRVKVGDKVYEETLWDKKFKTFVLDQNNISNVNISYIASENIFVDLNASYTPKDIKKVKDAMHNVKTLQVSASGDTAIQSIIQKADIGDKITMQARYVTTQAWQQVAVVVPIPSSTYILNPIGSSRWYDEYGSTVEPTIQFFQTADKNGYAYSCSPTHYEVAFDHLFVYYNSLEAGDCTVEFSVIKTHQGQASIAPIQLREMYGTNVRGRKYIK